MVKSLYESFHLREDGACQVHCNIPTTTELLVYDSVHKLYNYFQQFIATASVIYEESFILIFLHDSI